MVKLTDITIGCDPEFFLKRNGRFTPAEFTGITGTKEKPTPLSRGGAVQVDGCALEFNIAPAKSAREFDLYIKDTLEDIRAQVSNDFEFIFRPSITFSDTEWGRTSAKSKMLGCEPDYDAYSMTSKTPPQDAANRPFRTAAGHMHIGFLEGADVTDQNHIYDCSVITQFLDYTLGAFQHLWDDDNERRRIYGSAGSFRPKPYGLEYRVLSNKWVLDRPLRRFLFDYVKASVSGLLNGTEDFKYPKRGPGGNSPLSSLAVKAKKLGVAEQMVQAINSGSFPTQQSYYLTDALSRLTR